MTSLGATPGNPEQTSSDIRLATPTISLPKGGGAVRGIGEKFGNNPVTGTATALIPVATSPGRGGFGPSLTLSYDSGNGNGPYGFGWTLDLPQIRRSTERALPAYRDDADTFALIGAEDLVAVLDADGRALGHNDITTGYTVYRYRPRVESDYLRIERWVRDSDADTHWRTYSHDNVVSIYGKDSNSRIAEPAENPATARVFAWLISESRDCLGNAIAYRYKPEDGAGADLSAAHQRNRRRREDRARSTNRYLKSVRYGNARSLIDPHTAARPTHLDAATLDDARWMFELVLDYGEHNQAAPSPDDAREWAHRSDAFSSYRAGFEVRTARLCQRFLMFHHVIDVDGGPRGYQGLVRSTDLTYSQSPQGYSFLRSVTQRGYQRHGDGYMIGSLPPVEYHYTQATPTDQIRTVDMASIAELPAGLTPWASFVDLRGDGVPGVLIGTESAWYYAANRTPGSERGVQFGPVRCLPATPNATAPQFVDLAGDGTLDAVMFDDPTPGFYEYQPDLNWKQWRSFESVPRLELSPARTRFVDLTGDGLPDILCTDDQARMTWYPSLGEKGFETGRPTQQFIDDDTGPRLVFSDDAEGLHLADMSGDGLADLVRIGNAEVCYWPNLGYGRFGAKITMDMPLIDAGTLATFDHPDRFDPKRIRLADVDGSGTADIIYLHADGARLYFNRSGNELSAPAVLTSLAGVPDTAEVLAIDLLGNGTACLVWLSADPSDSGHQIRFVDLMGTKPHLLQQITNNLGAETVITYTTSTQACLADELAGRPWPTRLPFPVHVVARVNTRDLVSGNEFTELYAYHDGCFDGREREFRGFAMVERWDSEHPVARDNPDNPAAGDAELSSQTPPVHTKTWFHTGMRRKAPDGAGAAAQYWRPAHVQNTIATIDGQHIDHAEASRALKGSMIREEVWGDRNAPYSVAEHAYTIEQVQAPRAGAHGAYRRWRHDTITFHHEQQVDDPRIEQSLVVAVDDYGTAVKTLTVAYGRRDMSLTPTETRNLNADEKIRQAATLITYTDKLMTNPVDSRPPGGAQPGYPLDYRHPQTAEERSYHLTGLAPPGSGYFTVETFTDDLADGLDGIPEIAFEQAATPAQPQRRVIDTIRTVFRADTLDAVLPPRIQQSRGLRHEQLRLAFTPALLESVYGNDVDDAILATDGGYRKDSGDGSSWIPSGQPYYSPNRTDTAAQEFGYAAAHFFHALRYRDQFGSETAVQFDDHDLLLVEATDALGNRVSVGQRRPDGTRDQQSGNDYRVLAPQMMSDPNDNRTEVRFDPLGLVEASAVTGKPAPRSR